MILTGEGEEAFCSGGDQKLRGEGGYDDGTEEAPRLTVLDLHVQMRRCPKPIIAMVAGRWGGAWWGGGLSSSSSIRLPSSHPSQPTDVS